MDLPDFLASYQREVATLGKIVDETKARLAHLTGSATSEDGSVTVTVSATGALRGIVFGESADDVPVNSLAQVIMSTARSAHARASEQMMSAVTPLLDSESLALQRIQEFQATGEPAREEPVEDEDFGLESPL